jgi:excisionase family DNA binding protein
MSVFSFEKRLEAIEADLRVIKQTVAEIADYIRSIPKPSQQEMIMSAKEVAEYLNLDLDIVYNRCAKGQIPFYKVGKLYKFRKSELMEWMARQKPGSGFSVDDYVNRYLQTNKLKG